MRGYGWTTAAARRFTFSGTAAVVVSAAVLLNVAGAEIGAGQAVAAVSASSSMIAASPSTYPPVISNPKKAGLRKFDDGGNLGPCVPLGSASSFAEMRRLVRLAYDPANGEAITARSLQQARAVLALEKAGLLPASVHRDRTGEVDFIDGQGASWNVYDFNSKFSSYRDGSNLRSLIVETGVDLVHGRTVILITESLGIEKTKELKETIDSAGLSDRVLLWPGECTSA